MKTKIVALFTLLACMLPAFAADEHGHSHDKKPAGPNGGRVITAVEPHLEFFVTKERKVQLTALTEDLQPAKMNGQIISITAGDRANPTKMELKEENGVLHSSNALPEGNGFPVSISIKANPESKAIYEKFSLNLAACPTCKYAEYACICAH